ncbi:hypothetical protein WA026_001800 [Henosepilachna vigintioctopunctata]|uniref:Uncharacterized protein n=1 Tax=Henosepilachna vigintioctopunctata TaxID=420089 RepID=A0AAW1US17_9CUCU
MDKMFKAQKIILMICFVLKSSFGNDEGFKVDNWKFHFIPGTAMGLFMALAVPLTGPYKNTYLAYNFEANYALPGNETYYEYPPLLGRNVDRKLVYTALETKMRSYGYLGKPCMLRTICELASSSSILHANGIFGDILHIIFTPSSSENNDLEGDYEIAEEVGRQMKNCSKYSRKCTVSFLSLISWLEKSFQKKTIDK